MRNLPLELRESLLLVALEGFSHVEAAQAMDISLATLIIPDGGDATIAGVNLRTDPGEVRHRIGYVSQDGGTWDFTANRNSPADLPGPH